MTTPLDDPGDPRLSDFARLDEPGFRIKIEAARERVEGFFVVEGPLPIATLLRSRHRDRVRAVLVTPARLAGLAADLEGVAAPVFVADPDLLRAIVGFDLHRGAVASVDRFPLPDVPAVLADARTIAVCERVNDHENLGVIFRNAAALGIDAVLLDPECSDPLYRRCVRVSIGHVLTVPWTRVPQWPSGLDEVRSAGFTIAALTPRADAVPIERFVEEVAGRVAIVVGAEGPGLSGAALAAADVAVRIPMRAGVDSLNVATAAAIAFHRLVAGA